MPAKNAIWSFLSMYRFSVLLALSILVISLLPGSSIPDSPILNIRFMDKYIHFTMYGTFSAVALSEMRCRENCLLRHALLLIVAGSVSLCLEIIQGWVVEGRTADWTDLMANLSGLLAGYLLYRGLLRRKIRS